VNLPVIGRVRIPRPEQVAYYGALGALAALEIIEWPIALAIAAGHALVQNQHNRVAQEIGEALEDA
jgi:xanthosine utilization system XapX-like protein